jgi:hypothetical protein
MWIEGMDSGDLENFSLLDSDEVVRTPPTQATMTVATVEAGDRVCCFIKSGAFIDKAQYTSHNTNNALGDNTIELTTSLLQDTPPGSDTDNGVIRMVDNANNVEHRFRFKNWTGAIVTLQPEITSTTDQAGTPTRIWDAGIEGTNVKPGDCIRNSTDGSWAHITALGTDYLDTTPLQGGSDNTWENGDTYSIHTLPKTYDNSDKAYIPLIDAEATTTAVEQTILYLAERSVLVRVRVKGIQPYESTTPFNSGGASVSAIRTPDTIVS